jgi:hypothetical protein
MSKITQAMTHEELLRMRRETRPTRSLIDEVELEHFVNSVWNVRNDKVKLARVLAAWLKLKKN